MVKSLLALIAGIFALLSPAQATEGVQRDYMLNCQGCHLDDGMGFPERGVPRLTGYMGNFLKVPGGREFLVQVPGSASSSLSDEHLADLLNWMLARFSAQERPANYSPYNAAEVHRLRSSPLVAVTEKRSSLVRQIQQIVP